MKKWIEKFRKKFYDTESNIYILIMSGAIVLLLTTSCTTSVVLPGLCYNDKDRTHLCPKEHEQEQEEDKRDMEEFQDHYDYCEQFESDGETWMQCMMNEDIRRNYIRRLA